MSEAGEYLRLFAGMRSANDNCHKEANTFFS